MRALVVIPLAFSFGAAAFSQSAMQTIVFSKDDLGKLPKGWTATQTGEGQGSMWKVMADATTPSKSGFALAQTAKGPNAMFNLCVLNDKKFRDLELKVRLKAMAGDLDQGGGLVWRYRDKDNYYISRYNPLENNFRVYKVEKGKRTQLLSMADITYPADRWHQLVIVQKGKQIECELNKMYRMKVEDDTFPDAGQVGLWTKADAQTHFDELVITPK